MGAFKNLSMVSLSCLVLTILTVLIEYPFYAIYYDNKFESGCLQVTDACFSA